MALLPFPTDAIKGAIYDFAYNIAKPVVSKCPSNYHEYSISTSLVLFTEGNFEQP